MMVTKKMVYFKKMKMKKRHRNKKFGLFTGAIGLTGFLLLVVYAFADVPVMQDTNKEITMDVFGIAGSTMTATGKELNYCAGEPGGVTGLSGADNKELQAGFYCQDIYPPASITDLTGLPGDYARTVHLSWTAPGDDYGEASNLGYDDPDCMGKYELHYSSVSAYSWGDCPYQQVWSTYTTKGNYESKVVTGTVTQLIPGNTYYFWFKTADEELNWSDLSNKSTAPAQEVVLSVYLSTDTYNFGEVPLNTSTHTISIITVTNDGTVFENYGISCATTTPGGSDWTPGLTGETTGYNKFILKGVFHPTQCGPSEFDAWDTVEEDIKWSQTTSTFTAGSQTGVNVDIKNDDRNIWFRLEMPTTISVGKQQQITVTITAEENTE